MEEKKPDNIVWDKEKGYNAAILPYASNIGAPAISLDDVVGWKSKGVTKTNKEFSARYEELKAAYTTLVEEYQWNDLVYRSQYSFEPVVGETYYLYLRKSGEAFLSLLSPDEWKQPSFLGAFRLESSLKWTRIKQHTK
jgi:hypothetical protein